MISDASKQKGDEILLTNIDNFEDRKELTKAIEEFGADVVFSRDWTISAMAVSASLYLLK